MYDMFCVSHILVFGTFPYTCDFIYLARQFITIDFRLETVPPRIGNEEL